MIESMHRAEYKYSAYGLEIMSEIMIDELMPGKGVADINIFLGDVPSRIEFVVEETEQYQLSHTEFLFHIENVAGYYIRKGESIVVEPDKNADMNSVRVYLMGTAIGMLLLQRGIVPIHGSSIVINGGCIIFTGNCGAGKSTICSEFRRNEFEFLSDDVSVITINKVGIPMVQPAFPQQRLCSDTVVEMGYDTETLSLACMEDDKYVINSANNFKTEAIPLNAIFEISPEKVDNIEIQEIKGIEKIQRLIKNIYCILLLKQVGINPNYFTQCMDIAKKISFYKLIRPIGEFTVEEQIKMVIETMDI